MQEVHQWIGESSCVSRMSRGSHRVHQHCFGAHRDFRALVDQLQRSDAPIAHELHDLTEHCTGDVVSSEPTTTTRS